MGDAFFSIVIESPIVWVVFVVAAISYALLIDLCFFSKLSVEWFVRAGSWNQVIKVQLASLPLLGLLGTIVGLLSTFDVLSTSSHLNISEFTTSGISHALITTQLGLLLVVPGWLLQLFLQKRMSLFQIENMAEHRQ